MHEFKEAGEMERKEQAIEGRKSLLKRLAGKIADEVHEKGKWSTLHFPFCLQSEALSRFGWGLFYPIMYKGREASSLHALVFICPFPGKYGIIAREIPYVVILCRTGLIRVGVYICA